MGQEKKNHMGLNPRKLRAEQLEHVGLSTFLEIWLPRSWQELLRCVRVLHHAWTTPRLFWSGTSFSKGDKRFLGGGKEKKKHSPIGSLLKIPHHTFTENWYYRCLPTVTWRSSSAQKLVLRLLNTSLLIKQASSVNNMELTEFECPSIRWRIHLQLMLSSGYSSCTERVIPHTHRVDTPTWGAISLTLEDHSSSSTVCKTLGSVSNTDADLIRPTSCLRRLKLPHSNWEKYW